MSNDHTNSAAHSADAKRKIWITTAILAGITTSEFIIAGVTVGAEGIVHTVKVATFLILTLVKAYYIVSNFMHLGDELKRLIQAIILPFLFIVWLIIAMMKEGDSYGTDALKDQNQKIEHLKPTEAGHGDEHHETHEAPKH